MAGTQAGSTVAGPAGPTKEQMLAKIQQLTEQLSEANDQVANAKTKIKEPDVYDGERAKLENFLQELDIYFTARSGMNDLAKILFAASYFRETAASWFRPYMAGYTKNGGTDYPEVFDSYEGFKETLRNFFGDSDRQAALERKILAMIQKGSASDYVAQLQRLMMEANWRDDKTNMAIMLRGLKPEVQYETVKADPDDFKEAATIAVKVDNQLFNLKQLRKYGHWNQYGARHKKGNWKAKGRHPDAMDIDNVNLKLKSEKKQRKKGKCFNCGKEGHFARDCFRDKKPAGQRTEIRTTQLREVVEVLETPPRHNSPANEAPELFYTPEELESYRMTAEQGKLLDEWIEEELASFKDTTTPGHRGLGWWQCCEATKKPEMCARHYHEHERATRDECWTKYWRNAMDWECELHPIPGTIEFEGKKYILCQKANGRLATPTFCDRPNISTEIRLMPEDESAWYPEWKLIRIDIYSPGVQPMPLQTAEDTLDELTNSDLVYEDDWVRLEPQDSQITETQEHRQMEVRTTNLWRRGEGRGSEQPPAYASRIDVTLEGDNERQEEQSTRGMIRAQAGAIASNGEAMRALMKDNDELRVKMAQLAVEVEVMTTTADDWQTKANTVEERLERKIAGLEARMEQKSAQISKALASLLENVLKAQESQKEGGKRLREEIEGLEAQIKLSLARWGKQQTEMAETIRGLLDMFRWELEAEDETFDRVNNTLRKRMRETKVDDFISLWRELVTEEAVRKARTNHSGNDRAMRK
jgi:hypothetical protein